MPLKNLEYWVVVQLALDVGLLILVVFFIMKIRALSHLLQASHSGGAGHAQEITSLYQKIGDLEQSLERWVNQPTDQGPGHPNHSTRCDPQRRGQAHFNLEIDRSKSLRAQVEDLASRGLSAEEIARHLRLQVAEVKVALDLSRIMAK